MALNNASNSPVEILARTRARSL